MDKKRIIRKGDARDEYRVGESNIWFTMHDWQNSWKDGGWTVVKSEFSEKENRTYIYLEKGGN